MTEPSDLLWEATEYVTRDRVRRYAQVSGDANAIHLSDEAAKAAGLPSAIAHGYLILGIVLHHADHWAAANGVRITGCDTRFVRPVHLGSAPAELVVAGVRKVPGLILASAAVRGTDATTRAVLRPIRITYEPSAPRD
ncbi:MaoC/PaaZ C-terminal domain-containing protein [Gordonia sp. NPDC003585]|uniref:MaoC family dehydratase n=1 Tax=unclassified Gordonia (in: high G+C Gram-positive bacteria) TaxID=2657482 RepID=UPI0033AAAD84